MLSPIDNISLEKLQKISHQSISPFQLNFGKQIIQCDQLLRIVPGKRLVFLGSCSTIGETDEKFIIKTFVHSSRAKKHWLREHAGAKLLTDKQILTPELILQGISDEGVYFLIFRYIKGQSLASFWAENNQLQRERKLKQLMPVLAQHHRSGLLHQDLHYGNFFLDQQGSIYTLDGEELKNCKAPIKKKPALKNLALFLAQTFDLTPTNCLSLLNDYILLNALRLNKKQSTRFLHWIKYYQQQRIDQYLKKIVRNCTEVIYQKNRKQKGSYSLCRRQYHNQAMQDLLDRPEHYFQDQQAIFLKQGNTCTVKTVTIEDKHYVIKRYNPKGIAYELKHKGQISRARKSWINAHLLTFMGILSPQPIALIESNAALGKRYSYFICHYQPGQSSWDFFCDSQHLAKDKKLAAEQLISTLNQLYEYNISHGDLKGSNFLIHENKVWLLDLDAMVQHKMNWLFNRKWQRDKVRFLKNWDKKACYKAWKLYFESALKSK